MRTLYFAVIALFLLSFLFPFAIAGSGLDSPIALADRNGIKMDSSIQIIDGESFILINNLGLIFIKYHDELNESIIYHDSLIYSELFKLKTHDKSLLEIYDINKTLIKTYKIYRNSLENLITYGPISIFANTAIYILPGAILGVLFAAGTQLYKRLVII